MSKSYEKNTEEFYNELSTDCNPEKLLEIARQGIFLYEPLFKYDKIKNHEYVVEISILAGQKFMIYNQKQYDKFKEIVLMKDSLFKKCINPQANDISKICSLIIKNELYIEQLIKEENKDFINMFYMYGDSYLIFYLYKNNYISKFEFLYFYGIDYIQYNFYYFIEEYFFYGNRKYLDMMIESNDNYQKCLIIDYIVIRYASDINVLEYCSDIVKKYNLKCTASSGKIPLNFPLSTIKKYSKEIFLPNNIYITCPDKRVEDLVNSYFTDGQIEIKSNIDYLNKYRKRYDIENDIDPKLFIFHNSKSHNINLNILKNEKSVFNDNFIKLFSNYEKIYNFVELPKKTHYFKNCLKDPQFIKNLLDDPKYILSLDINDCINYDEQPIFLFCYLISLVHNNIYNSFIINYLLDCTVSYDDVRFEDNKFFFKLNDYHHYYRDTYEYECICVEYELYKLLSTTPNETFNNYVDIKEF